MLKITVLLQRGEKMRLIDWDKVLEWMHRQKETTEQWSMRIAIENYVDDMPTVDAVEVVRCKDCRYYEETDSRIGTCLLTISGAEVDGFCAWGEWGGDGDVV